MSKTVRYQVRGWDGLYTQEQLESVGWTRYLIRHHTTIVEVEVPRVAEHEKSVRNKACDKMFGVILSLPEDRRHNRSDIVEALYDAGYRKFEIVDGEA